MTIQNDALFDPADFNSVTISITFQNLTSGSAVIPCDQVTLQETAEDGLTIGLPRNSCNSNHNVQIELKREDPSRPDPLQLLATGKVTSIDLTDDPAVIRVRVVLQQFDEATWKTFLTLSDSRQQAINQFLNDAKG